MPLTFRYRAGDVQRERGETRPGGLWNNAAPGAAALSAP